MNATNPSTTTPRAVFGAAGAENATVASDRWLESGSYTRLKNIILGYTLPASVASRLGGGLQSPRIYINAQNVFTWTKYTGWDPEILGYGDPLARGIDDGYGHQPVISRGFCQRRRSHRFGGDLRLHVDCAPSPQVAVGDIARPGVVAPLRGVGEHRIDVTEEAERGTVGRGARERRDQVRALLAGAQQLRLEPDLSQKRGQVLERRALVAGRIAGVDAATPPAALEGVVAAPEGLGARVEVFLSGSFRYMIAPHQNRIVVTLDGVTAETATYHLAAGPVTGVTVLHPAGRQGRLDIVIATRTPLDVAESFLGERSLVIRLTPRGLGATRSPNPPRLQAPPVPKGTKPLLPAGENAPVLAGRAVIPRAVRVEAGSGQLIQVDGLMRVAVSDPQVLGERETLANYIKGMNLYGQRHWSAAAQVLRKVYASDAGYLETRGLLYRAYYQIGLDFKQQQEWQSALNAFQTAVAIDSDGAEAQAELAKTQTTIQTLQPGALGEKWIDINLSTQRFRALQGQTVLYSFVTSTGENGRETNPGRYQVLDKIPNAYSRFWNLWMPYWLGIYWAGSSENGIHALPILSNGQTLWAGYLGRRVSFGCVILDSSAAKLMYDWADIGTTVVIHY